MESRIKGDPIYMEQSEGGKREGRAVQGKGRNIVEAAMPHIGRKHGI